MLRLQYHINCYECNNNYDFFNGPKIDFIIVPNRISNYFWNVLIFLLYIGYSYILHKPYVLSKYHICLTKFAAMHNNAYRCKCLDSDFYDQFDFIHNHASQCIFMYNLGLKLFLEIFSHYIMVQKHAWLSMGMHKFGL